MSKPSKAPMHTAEHVLNQTMVALFGCNRCFSVHLNPKKTKCDFKFDRALTTDEIQTITDKINTVLAEHLDVCEEMMPRTEAEKLFDLSRLPAEAGDSLRIVRIGNYDACPCIGEHVENTSEIGTFNLASQDYNDGVLRIRFKLEK